MATIPVLTSLFFLIIFPLLLSAQDLTCTNLVKEVYSESQIKKPNSTDNPRVSYSKANTTVLDVQYKADSLSNKACSASNSCANGSSGLIYEVYYPDIKYSAKHRLPAIIFFHGGGLSDCSDLDQSGVQTYCIEFAKRGYVAFNVEYRRGRIEDIEKKFTSASQILAAYRAVQDARGAVRSIVQRELDKSTQYRIDPNNIFLAGASAGGDIALNVGFETPHMVNQAFSKVSSYLGAVDADNYYGNPQNGKYTIRGVLSMWGGLYVPLKFQNTPADFFSENNHIPALIAFHGGADGEVPITTSDVFFSAPPSVYNSETLCVSNGTFSLPDNGKKNADVKLLGSQGIYDALKTTLNLPCELYIDCDMEHGLDESVSDFGLANGNASAVTDKDVQKYIVERAATFFQYVMNANFPVKLTHSRFVNCENDRYGCNGDANTKCSDNAICPAGLKNSSITSAQNIVTKKETNNLFTATETGKVIYINFKQAGNYMIRLYDVNGIPLKSTHISNTKTVLDCSNFSSGIYLIQAIGETQLQTTKIVLH
jgi:poly(3-hydroxybutyrate) depolymerase